MVVIVKKLEGGKPIFNTVNVTDKMKMKAVKLDKELANIAPIVEKLWDQKRIKKNEKQLKQKAIDVEIAYRIGKKLAQIVDNTNLVSPNERQWAWKALREIYFKKNIFKNRGRTRDDLEYFYKASKYPLSFIKSITWDGWNRFLDYPSIRQDERFEKWFRAKAQKIGKIKRGFLRRFTKQLYFLIKNKDTTIFSDEEVFEIYCCAWEKSEEEK